jgi:hypothetical protein
MDCRDADALMVRVLLYRRSTREGADPKPLGSLMESPVLCDSRFCMDAPRAMKSSDGSSYSATRDVLCMLCADLQSMYSEALPCRMCSFRA